MSDAKNALVKQYRKFVKLTSGLLV